MKSPNSPARAIAFCELQPSWQGTDLLPDSHLPSSVANIVVSSPGTLGRKELVPGLSLSLVPEQGFGTGIGLGWWPDAGCDAKGHPQDRIRGQVMFSQHPEILSKKAP